MSVLFFPCIGSLVHHIIEPLIKKLYEIAMKVIDFLVKEVIVPLVTFLHEWGLIEVALYSELVKSISLVTFINLNMENNSLQNQRILQITESQKFESLVKPSKSLIKFKRKEFDSVKQQPIVSINSHHNSFDNVSKEKKSSE